ncbi:hypothetical protein FS842_010531 [Serendipita sp. 407]|nr:hypothetical protein FS842_010531 [Serendipita sp. 407]
MNLPIKFDGDEPEYVAALDKLEGLARKYNKPLVGFAFPEMTDFFEDRVRRNYQLLMVAADSYTMTYGLAMAGGSSRARVAEIQATMAKEKEEAAQQTNGHNGHQSNGISSKVEKGESEPEVVAVKA